MLDANDDTPSSFPRNLFNKQATKLWTPERTAKVWHKKQVQSKFVQKVNAKIVTHNPKQACIQHKTVQNTHENIVTYITIT